jgi:hypothetical protein
MGGKSCEGRRGRFNVPVQTRPVVLALTANEVNIVHNIRELRKVELGKTVCSTGTSTGWIAVASKHQPIQSIETTR